ncbi:transcriptional regulator ATRX-like isoform X4 [Quillaja saponaria]|uniref:Transcriptional regulator ATRX-like isoform X4 n=1 Tax=Quillaja saponaria TaxID=32244 RepID=A0AAD7PTG6_QUISA|nr:transcriptional regulator ATRX-like isoform X4 [Quillaja saponaria]
MPSEDLKIVKKEKVEEEEDSKKSLGSTKPTKVRNANGKVQPNNAKVKKEEPEAGDYPKQTNAATSGSRYKAAGVNKERNEDSEDDDDKPLCKRSSIVKLHKVSSTYLFPKIFGLRNFFLVIEEFKIL